METTIAEHGGHMIARIDGKDRVFEVAFDTIEPTDVTLRFIRDDERVGSIYNDDGTARTMARLTTGREGSDFVIALGSPLVSRVLVLLWNVVDDANTGPRSPFAELIL
jgi:hypothetical protein